MEEGDPSIRDNPDHESVTEAQAKLSPVNVASDDGLSMKFVEDGAMTGLEKILNTQSPRGHRTTHRSDLKSELKGTFERAKKRRIEPLALERVPPRLSLEAENVNEQCIVAGGAEPSVEDRAAPLQGAFVDCMDRSATILCRQNSPQVDTIGPRCLADAVTAAHLIRAQGIDLPEPNRFSLRPLPLSDFHRAPIDMPSLEFGAGNGQCIVAAGAVDPSLATINSVELNEDAPQNGVDSIPMVTGIDGLSHTRPRVRRAAELLGKIISPPVSLKPRPAAQPGSNAPVHHAPSPARSVSALWSAAKHASNPGFPAPTSLSEYLPDYLCSVMHRYVGDAGKETNPVFFLSCLV